MLSGKSIPFQVLRLHGVHGFSRASPFSGLAASIRSATSKSNIQRGKGGGGGGGGEGGRGGGGGKNESDERVAVKGVGPRLVNRVVEFFSAASVLLRRGNCKIAGLTSGEKAANS